MEWEDETLKNDEQQNEVVVVVWKREVSGSPRYAVNKGAHTEQLCGGPLLEHQPFAFLQ